MLGSAPGVKEGAGSGLMELDLRGTLGGTFFFSLGTTSSFWAGGSFLLLLFAREVKRMLEGQVLTFIKQSIHAHNVLRCTQRKLGGLLFLLLDTKLNYAIKVKSILKLSFNGIDFYTERDILST